MSHHVSVTTLPPDGEKLQLTKFTSWRSILMLTGVAGVAASLLLFFTGGEAANSYAFSYLFALEVFFTITAGATFWVLLHNASNSSWGVAIRRIPELMTQLFLPLFSSPFRSSCPFSRINRNGWGISGNGSESMLKSWSMPRAECPVCAMLSR